MTCTTATVPCGHCGGAGRLELTGVYAETLDLLRRQQAEVNGAQLAKLAGCTNMAMCNRLVALERNGLATSRRYGQQRLWKAVK
jgi:hypothetical protein